MGFPHQPQILMGRRTASTTLPISRTLLKPESHPDASERMRKIKEKQKKIFDRGAKQSACTEGWWQGDDADWWWTKMEASQGDRHRCQPSIVRHRSRGAWWNLQTKSQIAIMRDNIYNIKLTIAGAILITIAITRNTMDRSHHELYTPISKFLK